MTLNNPKPRFQGHANMIDTKYVRTKDTAKVTMEGE